MGHSFTHLLYHIVFATKERRPTLDAPLRPDLFALFAELVRTERGQPLAINGIADHVHLLIRLRADRPLAHVVRTLKARSSRWIRETTAEGATFSWQTGYSAFTVSMSQSETVRAYVQKQEEHHRKMTFSEEYDRLLRAHGLSIVDAATSEK